MKKALLPISLFINCVLVIYFAVTFHTKSIDVSHNHSSAPQKTIFILSPAVHPSLDQIEKGALASIKKAIPNASIRLMNANGKKTLMLAQVQEAVAAKPDAIITIGTNATQLVHEFIKKRNSNTPHIFTAVANPTELGLVYNQQKLTGITEKPHYAITSNILNHLAPEIRSLLLVYNPSENASLEQESKALTAALQSNNISLFPLEIFQTSEITQKTKPLLAHYDGIIILKDNTVVSGIDGLVKLCEQYNKKLIAHDLDSGDKGAVLSFGSQEKYFGTEAGKIAVDMLLEKKPLPPIKTLDINHIKINTAAAKRQNLQLKPIEVTLLKSVIIV
ncbi:hypothetical protein FJ364_01455 [Candidatus Dependentiae bacterium]|nr:hypothetical protein [Candidatus Dependentiae bacterium]